MAWKNKPPLSLEERLRRIKESAIGSEPPEPKSDDDQLETIGERVDKIFEIVHRRDVNAGNMLFFVMYDIESTKVRNQIAKYLLRQGCHRIQKSIFLANLDGDKFAKIKSDLVQVQSYYENEDSILVVPISTDYLKAMKIIGQSIDIDVITRSKSTLFF